MAKFSNHGKQQRNQKPFSTETVHLGTFLHTAGDLLVLKMEHKDIPYPNAPVLHNKKQIGKIDEVFGPVDDVHASVKLDATSKADDFAVNSKFEGYKDKFIFKDRFLPRELVERNKEKKDKQQMPKQAQRQRPGSRDGKKGNFSKNTNDRSGSSWQKGKFNKGRSNGRN